VFAACVPYPSWISANARIPLPTAASTVRDRCDASWECVKFGAALWACFVEFNFSGSLSRLTLYLAPGALMRGSVHVIWYAWRHLEPLGVVHQNAMSAFASLFAVSFSQSMTFIDLPIVAARASHNFPAR
jgi:hypothetical protein